MKIILRIYILYSETWVKNNKKKGGGEESESEKSF